MNSNVAYFDPNTYGTKGYSMIGPLLLFYERLVVYGPLGSFIESAYNDSMEKSSSLTPDEFITAILKGYITPLGFSSFFSKSEREKHKRPELRVSTDFDRDLIESKFLGENRYIINDHFKLNESPQIAKLLVDDDPSLKNGIIIAGQKTNQLPERYVDLLAGNSSYGDGHSKFFETECVDELFPYIVVQDWLNNRYVISEESTASNYVQYRNFENLYNAIHRVHSPCHDRALEDISIITDVLSLCLSLKCDPSSRLTLEEIEEFRALHRKDFISCVSQVSSKFQSLTDKHLKKELISEELTKQIKGVSLSLRSTEKIIDSIPFLKATAKPILGIMDGKKSRTLDFFRRALNRPLSKRDQWIYHILRNY